MTGVAFPWILAGIAAAVDVVGLFYLWRRRKDTLSVNHKPSAAAQRLRTPAVERRRTERRAASRTASA